MGSDTRNIAFFAFITGGGTTNDNNQGIWSGTVGDLHVVARKGTLAPGIGDEVKLGSLFAPAVNNIGQVVFGSTLSGATVDATNDQALWVTGGNGELILIARTGDPFDVRPDPLVDDFRTIASISVFASNGVEGGFATPLNDAGQVPFTLTFDDGTKGLFVANTRDMLSFVNGDFQSGSLKGWIPGGSGDVRIVEREESDEEFAVELVAGSPVSLRQDFLGLEDVFQITFEYLLPSDAGTIEVALDGHILSTDTFSRR